jgi:DNA-binding LytR/AlgR family response regulator
MSTCIVVDDELPARNLLKEYIKKLPHLELLGEFKNPLQALDLLSKRSVDLIFLDIQMPGMTGLEFLKTLNYSGSVILTTAYSEYALDGFELDVTDYLMKPFKFERFLKAVNKVVAIPKTIETSAESRSDQLLIKADGQVHRIKKSEIIYIEGLREYVTFYLEHKKIIVLDALKRLEEQLQDDGFLRIHKSFIVNEKCVTSYSGQFLMLMDKKIPIGANYKEEVLKKLFQ